jgi:hypothetical protein
MGTKLKLTTVPVTILVAALTGSSAANPALVSQSQIIGVVPAGLATTTGVIESAVLNADGSVTVVTQAAVADANMLVNVIVATTVNSD